MQKRGYYDFPLKIFCLTVPKRIVGEPFDVSGNFRGQKNLRIRGGGGGITSLRRKKICLRVQKTSEGYPSVFQKNFGFEKIYRKTGGRGVSRLSVEKLFPYSTQIFRRGEPFCVSEKSQYRQLSCITMGHV